MLLVGHSMGGLLCIEYVGAGGAATRRRIHRGVVHGDPPRPRAGRRTGSLARGFDSLPDRGMWLTNRMLDRILPDETRADFGAGGYALDAQDIALRSLSVLDLLAALHRIDVPLWFVNGQFDQLRVNERLFLQVAQHAELIVVPRTTHLVTVMRPRVFNAILDVAITTTRTDLIDSVIGLRVGSTPSRPPCGIPLLPLGTSIASLRTKDRRHVANIKSQIKRNKTNDKAHERNKAVKSELRTAVRRTREADRRRRQGRRREVARHARPRSSTRPSARASSTQNQAANRKSAIAKQVAAL